MKAILNIVGVLASIVIGLVLFILIIITPLLLALSSTLTNRESIKNVLLNSQLTTLVSDQIVKELSSQLKESGLPSKDVKKLEPTIKKEISSQYINNNLTAILDGGYNWFEGKTESLKISTEQLKLNTILANLIPTKYLNNEGIAKGISGFKACKEAQTSFLESTKKIESLDQLCIPKQLDVLTIIKQNESSVVKQPAGIASSFFPMPTSTSEYLETAKLFFSLISYSYLIIGFVLTILALMYVFIPPGQLLKSFILSISIIGISAVNFILFSSDKILKLVLNLIVSNEDGNDTQIPTGVLISIIEKMFAEVNSRGAKYSLIILAIGIIILLATIYTNSKKS